MMKSNNSCCSPQKKTAIDTAGEKTPKWQTGKVKIPSGEIPKVSTNLPFGDFIGTLMVRLSINRSHYRIKPGLYAIGNPNKTSYIFVSANYKLSFDSLRKELKGIDGWILVLDTKGINVWCAAGKGTFGTKELISKIEQTGLGNIVSNRKVILPQLGAPGVAAHEVKKKTGFSIVYGPVRAKDIPEFLKNGCKATSTMREVTFSFLDRLVLTPVELAGTLKYCGLLFLFFIVYSWITMGTASFGQVLLSAFLLFLPFFGAVLTGTILIPLFLPFIPGKAFAWKGWILGAVWTGMYLFFIIPSVTWTDIVSYSLLLPAISAFLAMSFTGATSYTSLSGVLYEMKYALPIIIISICCGAVFSIVINVIQFVT